MPNNCYRCSSNIRVCDDCSYCESCGCDAIMFEFGELTMLNPEYLDELVFDLLRYVSAKRKNSSD